MKKISSLLLLAILAVSVNAQFNAEKTPLVTKSLSADNIKSILSETSGGNISVTGVSAPDAKIEIYVVPNNYRKNNLSETEIRERMKSDYDLTVEVTNGKLTASAKSKDRKMDWRKSLNFSFKIFVPANVSTDLSTSGGNISLNNLTGEQKFSTSGGNLDIDHVNGKMDGTTSGGNINLENSRSNDADLTTSGGNIEARNSEGKLRLTTSGGSVNLTDLKGEIKGTTSGGNVSGKNIGGELVASTSGGNVHLTDLSCSLETSTSGGNISVSIKQLGKYVRIGNSGGDIDLVLPKDKGVDLDLSASKIKTDNLDGFNGKLNINDKDDNDEVVGKLNGGGVPVRVRAGSGKIYLGLK